jgi:hypothetical protein
MLVSAGESDDAGAADDSGEELEEGEEDADLYCGASKQELSPQLLPDAGHSKESLRVAVELHPVVLVRRIGRWILDAPRRFRAASAATKQQYGFVFAFVCVHIVLGVVFILLNNGRLAIPPRL